jgi:hypothetical protein
MGAGNPVSTASGSTNGGPGGAPGQVTVPSTTVPKITIPAG